MKLIKFNTGRHPGKPRNNFKNKLMTYIVAIGLTLSGTGCENKITIKDVWGAYEKTEQSREEYNDQVRYLERLNSQLEWYEAKIKETENKDKKASYIKQREDVINNIKETKIRAEEKNIQNKEDVDNYHKLAQEYDKRINNIDTSQSYEEKDPEPTPNDLFN